MWKDISLFELRYQLKQPLFSISALIFFFLAVGLAASDIGGAIGDAPGTTLRNAPITLIRLMPLISLLGLFVITAFVANSALRDFDQRSDMFFFTKPLTKIDYLGGRFVGSMAVSLLVLLAAVAGLVAGYFAPWQTTDRLGPFSLAPYLFGLLVILIPNLLAMGALFFALATWSRRLSVTFLCVVFFIGMQDAIELVALNTENRALGSLLEPSGIVALETVARYWTIAEQNTLMPALGGVLLANRLLWMGFAFLVLAASLARFDFTLRERRPKKASKSKLATVTAEAPTPPEAIALPKVNGTFGAADHWRQLLLQTRLEVSEVVPRTPFLTLLVFGLMFVGVYGFIAGQHNGMPSYPLTQLMLGAVGLGVRLTLVMILVFYAGELVFSQRALKLSEVYDALPVPNWVFLTAKLLALVSVAGVFLFAATLTTILIQLGKGYFNLEPGLYAKGLLILGYPLFLLIVLAVFFQVLVNHKFAGLLMMTVALLLRFALPRLGFEHNLYLYASHPAVGYTAINGYGHHAAPFAWFMLYWTFGALVLAAATLLLWPRGTSIPMRQRLAVARQRLTTPVMATMVVGLLGMGSVGGWIFANTNVRNEYLDRNRIPQKLADYERQYAQYREVALPRVTSVFAEVDIFPEARQVALRGRYRLENQGTEPVRQLPITISPRWVEGVLRVYGGVTLEQIDLPPHQVLVEDGALGFYVYELEQPLAAGEAIDLGFAVRVDHEAFTNRRHNNLVIKNGTFFSNSNFMPMIGYARSNQLINPTERQKRDLPEVVRVADLDDASARQRNYLDADWIEFEAILSTSANQVAIAPGNLEREWTEGDRRFFHYKTHAPITNLLPFLSGEYDVMRDRWEHVEIEVYYAPDHAFNIERFLEVTKKSLTYMTANFGPYAHDQLRIIEVPNYHDKVAFAFAQTIPFSESWCFTANLEAARLDWLTAIHAHEVSHQWWNHQVVPGDVQGATLIAESLAQYSAMMILEEMYGPEMVRHFLKFHLDRYLERRGDERVREMPLSRVENQAYVHYSKASLSLYALKDLIGEDAVNQALRAFLESAKYQGPPYVTSRDLLAYLREVVPADHEHLIEDLFETITVFDNRAVEATYTEQADGTFVVELATATHKLRGDGYGTTTEIAIDDWVDVGVFGEQEVDGKMQETVLAFEKYHLQSKTGSFQFVVDQKPVRAGIDPYNKLIDRDSGDNVRTLTQRSVR